MNLFSLINIDTEMDNGVYAPSTKGYFFKYGR